MVCMETLKVQMQERKAKIVREKAMGIYGYSKGSISKALNSAVDGWLEKVEAKKGTIKAKEITGIVSDLKDSSLRAQKKAIKAMGLAD